MPAEQPAEPAPRWAQWRALERKRLLAERQALDTNFRASQTLAIAADLDRLMSSDAGQIVSVYWPIRGEPDLRPWMQRRWQNGTRIALPVATALRVPLVFREWHPEASMARGLWKIPYPADTAEVTPTTVIAPLVGFDHEGYRLGYGGGFFDRTLALLRPPPLVIGVGYVTSEIHTIFPQPHDIPMGFIVSGSRPPITSRVPCR